MTRRQVRLSHQIRSEISDLLLKEAKDPRLSGLVSITQVTLSADMRQATIFVSILGSEEDKKTVLEGMASATGFLRRELGHRLEMRHVPALTFCRDDSLERGAHLLELIEETSRHQAPQESVQE